MQSPGPWHQRLAAAVSTRLRTAGHALQRLAGIIPEAPRRAVADVADSVWKWITTSPNIGPWSVILVCTIVLLAQAFGYHKAYLPWYPENGLEVPPNWREPLFSSLFYHYIAPYLKLIAMIGGVMFHLAMLKSTINIRRLIIPLWIALGFLAIWVIMADFYEQWERVSNMTIGQPHSAWAYTGKAIALAFVIFSPALTLSYYQSCLVWEKHVLKSVAQPLAFCILSIACIVVLFDLEDNLKDFQKEKVPMVQILGFYINLFPHIFVEAAAPALTLATLFGLVRMVRFNELIALLNAGLSLRQVVTPILVLAAFVSLIATAANYHWAPGAEGQRQAILLGLRSGGGGSILHANVMHYNEQDRRTWFIGVVPFNLREEKMKRVQVHQYDEQGHLIQAIFAPTVVWWPQGMWSFYRGQEVTYKDGVATNTTDFAARFNGVQRRDTYWKETPWDIMVPTLNPNDMGVPELAAYLETPGMIVEPNQRKHYTAEMLHRFSYGWQGFCLVLITIPLICRTSRNAVISGSGMVLAAFVANHFLLNNISIKLARSAVIPPGLAAWIPHLIVGVPAFLLLWWRSSHFQMPNLSGIMTGRWRDRWRILRGRRTRPWRGRANRASWLNETLRSL